MEKRTSCDAHLWDGVSFDNLEKLQEIRDGHQAMAQKECADRKSVIVLFTIPAVYQVDSPFSKDIFIISSGRFTPKS